MGVVPFAGIAEAAVEVAEVWTEGIAKAVSGGSFERPGVEYESVLCLRL